MVYRHAARKTGAFMVVSAVLGLAVVTFLSGSLEVTGQVVAEGATAEPSGAGWILYILGAFTGAVLVGTYVYVAHLEGKQ